MASPLQGEPERAPIAGSAGAGGLRTFAEAFFPHSADHGESLFDHPSTNRGGTPNALNGEPVSGFGTGRHAEGNGPSRLAEPRRGGGLGRSGELTPMARKTSGGLRSASPTPRPAPTSY